MLLLTAAVSSFETERGMVVLSASAGWAEDAGGSTSISFRFAPPDGTEFVQTLSTTRENRLEGLAMSLE